MKRALIYAFYTFFIMFTSCSKKYEFWDISKFNIDETSLKDSTKLKLLYCSRGPDVPMEFENKIGTISSSGENPMDPFRVTDYYVHYIVLNIENDDTLNILAPEAIEVNEEDVNSIFYYTKEIDPFKKMMFNMEYVQNLKDGEKINNDKFVVPILDKVARDPNFDQVSDNDYKTIIGFVHRVK